MAFAATISASEPRAFPYGGSLRAEIYTFSADSADTSGTLTSKNLHTIYHVIYDGLVATAATTFSGNVATLTFADPAATVYGTALVIGV